MKVLLLAILPVLALCQDDALNGYVDQVLHEALELILEQQLDPLDLPNATLPLKTQERSGTMTIKDGVCIGGSGIRRISDAILENDVVTAETEWWEIEATYVVEIVLDDQEETFNGTATATIHHAGGNLSIALQPEPPHLDNFSANQDEEMIIDVTGISDDTISSQAALVFDQALRNISKAYFMDVWEDVLNQSIPLVDPPSLGH